MFEMARDFIRFECTNDFELVGGFFSPVGDAYLKSGLAQAIHRVRMVELATNQSKWITCDNWEALHKEYQPTAKVLDHFAHEINEARGGIEIEGSTERKPARIALLAGADLIETMSSPGVWAPEDLDHILGEFGAFIVERAGTDTSAALKSLEKWRKNIWVIPQLVSNDISSTKIRLFLRRDMSIRWLVPDLVERYIEEHGLFMHDDPNGPAPQDKEQSQKDRDSPNPSPRPSPPRDVVPGKA